MPINNNKSMKMYHFAMELDISDRDELPHYQTLAKALEQKDLLHFFKYAARHYGGWLEREGGTKFTIKVESKDEIEVQALKDKLSMVLAKLDSEFHIDTTQFYFTKSDKKKNDALLTKENFKELEKECKQMIVAQAGIQSDVERLSGMLDKGNLFEESLSLKESFKKREPITQPMISSTQQNVSKFTEIKKRMQHESDIAPIKGSTEDMIGYFQAKSFMERCDNAHRQVWQILTTAKSKLENNKAASLTEEPTNVAQEVTPPKAVRPKYEIFMPPPPPKKIEGKYYRPAFLPTPPPPPAASDISENLAAEEREPSFPPLTPPKTSPPRSSVNTPAAGLTQFGMFAHSPPSTPPGSPKKQQRVEGEQETNKDTPKGPR